MQVLKTFMRAGVLYRSGDKQPPDLDAPTISHYRRHGMIGDDSDAKPAAVRRRSIVKPAEIKPAAPAQQLASGDAVHTHAQSGEDAAGTAGHEAETQQAPQE